MLAAADFRRRPVLGVVGALAVAVVTLTGCAAGQDAQTVEQTSVVDGTAFQAGDIALRDVGLRAPSGSSYATGQNAYLEGLVVNRAATSDQLVSVTSPVATKVVFYADGVSALLGSAATTGVTPSATGSTPTASSTASENTGAPSQPGTPDATGSSASAPTDGTTTSAGATPSATSSAAATQPLTSLPLATNRSVQFGYGNGQPAILFLGLTKALFPSQSFQVTFTFANGGSVTATVAVKLPVDSTLQAPTESIEASEG